MKSEIAEGVKTEGQRMLVWMLMKIHLLKSKQIHEVVEAILSTQSQDNPPKNIKMIFCGGLGKSGFAARSFGTRLFHLGFSARCIGEDTVPPVGKGDLFIAVTGSGTNLLDSLQSARDLGAKIIVVTYKKESKAAKLADIVFCFPNQGREREVKVLTYEERRVKGHAVMPLGSSFEIFAQVIFEAIIGQILVMRKEKEANLEKRHANVQTA